MARTFYTLSIPFEDPDQSGGLSGDWLQIVQPEWAEQDESGFAAWLTATGKSLPSGGTRYIEALFTALSQYKSSCDDKGCLEVELRIHRSRTDLAYRLVASYGELSQKFIQSATVTESIDIEMEESVTIEREIISSAAMSWDGDVYDIDGNELSVLPVITRSGNTCTWGQKLVGTLRLTYTEEHDTYVLTILPRAKGDYDPERLESAYESTVRAFWGSGQLDTHEVDLPSMTGNCRGGGTVSFNDDDDDVRCVRHVIEVDPCDESTIIREFDEPMECPEEEPATEEAEA